LPPRLSGAVAVKKARCCAGWAGFWMAITSSAAFKLPSRNIHANLQAKWLKKRMDIAQSMFDLHRASD
jgi:hypothetical protein